MIDVNRRRTECHEALLGNLDALYGYAMVLSRDRTMAEDLVQETFTQGAANFAELREESNVKGWLFTIMRNVWLKQLRHARSGPEFVPIDEVAGLRSADDSSHDPQVVCMRIWERDEIRSALEQLPVMHREIIVLFDIEGFSYKEIAGMLDCPVGTIMSRLARARKKLKGVLLARQDVSLRKTAPSGS